MGLFTPKHPKSDTPGAASTPARRESRGDRRAREERERIDTAMAQGWKAARRASTERGAAFWEDYEQRNGPGSVDWTA